MRQCRRPKDFVSKSDIPPNDHQSRTAAVPSLSREPGRTVFRYASVVSPTDVAAHCCSALRARQRQLQDNSFSDLQTDRAGESHAALADINGGGHEFGTENTPEMNGGSGQHRESNAVFPEP